MVTIQPDLAAPDTMQDHPTAPGDELMQHFEDLTDPRGQTDRFQYPL
ncbi:hypothetical protein X805_36260 [Sphaerotilus natans subsp. natans DSM 6575]|uniref:Uncharacterized protein n=1 Tax=Sphaerotilus natans subsp. natans DSM 6575 TaxID=1286631 RepID=A0A059KH39_9BURK|nr:hypothetical protein X805_36260 [Sphaerotilus natans subsp. natans DSM 6575]